MHTLFEYTPEIWCRIYCLTLTL